MFLRFSKAILALATVVSCVAGTEAQANPRIGVSFGSGGVRIGIGNGPMYGPGYYGPGYYGPGYYGPGYRSVPVYVPQPVYVQPQPVYVQPRPVYTQPQYSTSPAGPPPLADGGEILIFSPSTNTGNIRYTLNGQPYTMPPGTKQRFTNDRKWTIQFESAPGRVLTYSLSADRYKFTSNEEGIGFFQTQDLPEVAQPGLPPAPIPNPPEAPALKTNP